MINTHAMRGGGRREDRTCSVSAAIDCTLLSSSSNLACKFAIDDITWCIIV